MTDQHISVSVGDDYSSSPRYASRNSDGECATLIGLCAVIVCILSIVGIARMAIALHDGVGVRSHFHDTTCVVRNTTQITVTNSGRIYDIPVNVSLVPSGAIDIGLLIRDCQNNNARCILYMQEFIANTNAFECTYDDRTSNPIHIRMEAPNYDSEEGLLYMAAIGLFFSAIILLIGCAAFCWR